MIIPTPAGVPSAVIPFTYVNGHLVVEITAPSPDDLDHLPLYVVTLDKPWIDQTTTVQQFDKTKIQRGMSDNMDQALSDSRDEIEQDTYSRESRTDAMALRQETIIATKELNESQKYAWKEHLYINDDNVLTKTLAATTQLAVIETDPALTRLKQHEKRRIYQPSSPRLNNVYYTDTIVPKRNMPAASGAQYMQLYTGSRSTYIWLYRMNKRSEFIQSLLSFITNVGIMDTLVRDGAAEQIDNAVKGHTQEIRHTIRKDGSLPSTPEPKQNKG
jgi:hypothetical protein